MATQAHILVVDDEKKICEFLAVLLGREGYQVAAAHNAADALDHVGREPVDMVITDLKMPGMDGFELVTRLKALKPDLPVVMITGYATVETAVRALRHGVDDYVTKPFNIEELRKVVSRSLQTARIERENRELIQRLKETNAELARHRLLLAEKVRRTGSELEEARLLIDQYQGEIEVFSELGELAATEQDINRLMEYLTRRLMERLGAGAGSIMLREGDSLVLCGCDAARAGRLVGTRQGLADGIAGRVASDQVPLLVKDIQDHPSLRPTPGRSYRTDSFLCVPVVHYRRTLGIISLCDRANGQAFDDQGRELVNAVARQIAPVVENAALYRTLEERCVAVIEALVNTLEAKDHYTSGHSRRVSQYACALAQAMGSNPAEIELLRRAACLHDIGKIGVHESILEKPSRLTPEERNLVQEHPSTGEVIVKPLDFLRPLRPLIRHHHERMDGQGYPDHLCGADIPMLARILTIADAFDAMTSERPYRPAMSHRNAATELMAHAGRQFDARLAGLFCDKVLAA